MKMCERMETVKEKLKELCTERKKPMKRFPGGGGKPSLSDIEECLVLSIDKMCS